MFNKILNRMMLFVPPSCSVETFIFHQNCEEDEKLSRIYFAAFNDYPLNKRSIVFDSSVQLNDSPCSAELFKSFRFEALQSSCVIKRRPSNKISLASFRRDFTVSDETLRSA